MSDNAVNTMLPFKRIVFPIDYSQTCRATVPYVDGMTKHFSAHLTVVRAYSNTNWLKQVEEQEQRKLHEFVAEAFPTQHVDAFLEEAEPASFIEKVAREQEADLVMLPTRGLDPARRVYGIERGIGPSLLESTTAKVLHHLSAAIWTSANPVWEGQPRHVLYNSLLCAVEFSEETEAVLRAAAALASSYQAHLSLIHVVHSPEPDLIAAANERLDTWKRKLAIAACHKVLSGTTADAVCHEAAREKADLIIAGRGLSQGALTRLLSELYTIVRESPCPVLSI
jgi:nucleotide-binding universal stress UspA family protein